MSRNADAPDRSAPARRAKAFRTLAVCGVCVAIAFLVYAPALRNEFYNDDAYFLGDAKSIGNNAPAILGLNPLGYYRPVWSAWVWALFRIFGLWAAPYFAAGIVLHGVIGSLVWVLARQLRLGATAAWISAIGFLAFYSHSEATLWMAAHNSSLAAGLALLAVVLHLRAMERGGILAAAGASLALMAALFTKETAIAAIVWIPLAQWARFGWRSLFTRESLGRYALHAAAVAAFWFADERIRLGAAMVQDPSTSRAGLQNVRVSRIVGAFGLLFEPAGVLPVEVCWGRGAAALFVVFAAVAVLRRDLWRQAVAATAIALVALAPTSATYQQMGTPFRLYYFPTVGAALLLGILWSCLDSPAIAARLGARGGAWLRGAAIVGFAGWVGWCAVGIRAVNDAYYRPQSHAQSAFARRLQPYLSEGRRPRLLFLEPPINQILHIQKFLNLYHDVPEELVTQHILKRADAQGWLDGRLGDPAVTALEWTADRGILPTKTFPRAFHISWEGALGRDPAWSEPEFVTAYEIVWDSPAGR